MKNLKFTLYLATFFIIASCASLDKVAISNLQKVNFQQSVLKPDYELYGLRIDLIRQEVEDGPDSTKKKKPAPYNYLGFNLGNGLFLDLSSNLSFLIPELFNIEKGKNFRIREEKDGFFGTVKGYYTRDNDKYIVEGKALVKFASSIKIEESDSIVSVNAGFLSKYKIIKGSNYLATGKGIFQTKIEKSRDGYFVKHLFGNETFTLKDSALRLSTIEVVNTGNEIKIYTASLLARHRLLYKIIKSDNEIYIYDKHYYGVKISKTGNRIIIENNKRKTATYYLES